MRIAPLFKKYVVPHFANINYRIVDQSGGVFIFCNEKKTTAVRLMLTRHCPVSLINEYAEIWEREGPKMPPRALRIHYGVDATYRSESIDPEHLRLGTTLDEAFFYYDEESFRVIAEELVRQATEIVCPYLDTVAEQAVFLQDAPYHLLKDRPKERAESFALKYALPLQGEGKEIQCLIDRVFLRMLPQRLSERKEAFFQKLEDITGLAAYCGEMILQRCPNGHWDDFEPQPFAEDVSRYGIWTKEDLAEDVMWDVIASWNLSPQVEHIGLHNRYIMNYFGTKALWGDLGQVIY